MSTNKWMDKQIGVYPYFGILLSHKKERTTDTYTNTDKFQNYYAEWLYDSINDSRKCALTYHDRKQFGGCLRIG